MPKEKFIETLTELKALSDAMNNLNKAFKPFEPSFNQVSFGRYEALVVNTLSIAMNDKSDWISYFIYECDWGKKNRSVEIDKKPFKLTTLSNLYNLLTL